jgi:hypothetical protein
VLDGVRGEQLERDRDVAEGEVEVDQADLAGALVGQGERQVHCNRGLPDPALGREDRDHLTVVARRLGTAERLRELMGPVDRTGDQVEVVHRHHLAGAGLHRSGQDRGVQRGPDEDHAGRRA